MQSRAARVERAARRRRVAARDAQRAVPPRHDRVVEIRRDAEAARLRRVSCCCCEPREEPRVVRGRQVAPHELDVEVRAVARAEAEVRRDGAAHAEALLEVDVQKELEPELGVGAVAVALALRGLH